MGSKAKIIDHIFDMCGDEWDVREFLACPPPIEWRLAFGWPSGYPRGRGGAGGPRTILTAELAELAESIRYSREPMVELQAKTGLGRGRVLRIRNLLGHSRSADRKDWFIEHAEELHTMKSAAFARKYGKSDGWADNAYEELFGSKRGHPTSWWKDPEAIKILASDIATVDKADKLGRTIRAVWGARWLLGITFT